MNRRGPLSERALILAPIGRDAQIAGAILREAGYDSDPCPDLPALARELDAGAGCVIISDQGLHRADLAPLDRFLKNQPSWSDIPIILLSLRGDGTEQIPAAGKLAERLGNVTFLERPLHPASLIGTVRTALRGRRRQYEARARLKELREGEQRLHTALKAGRLGAWTLDLPSLTLHCSDSCKAHFGRGAEGSFLYADFQDSIHPDDRAQVQAAFEQTVKTGTDYAVEHRLHWLDGSVHWVDLRARAIRSRDGAVSQLVGVSSDITARKRADFERERLLNELAAERAALSDLTATLEQRVRERTAALTTEVAARERAQEQLLQSQKMESIGQLTGGVAHDFNNLLMAVMGNLQLLKKRFRDDDRAQHLIAGALEGARRGASLTQRMLTFARQQELKTTSADLLSLVGGMQDLLDRTLGPQFELRFDLSEGLPAAQVDANQIELAILNLAINARDAMPDGGTICIGLDKAAPPAAKGLKDAEYLRLRLSDTGSGMDGATLKKAIEPFFSTKPTGKGTGLGLSMVHGLAVQLGGMLELESTVGKGTTATLWLPIAEAPAEIPEARPAPAESGSRAIILVVDDDPLIAMSTVEMLEDLGHQAIEANSGAQALEILKDGQAIDLMLTDQAMPGMTGLELAEIARKERPKMPILLATGYADLPASQIKLPRLSKPYLQTELQEEINRLLDGAA
ncbi:response regulator [Dongia sedimenti]|uniref:histidine kinase n=1 Tax=Dongia sedimenti TaxID=3064282 RepID=A0ABU0YM20_9PROT|nr:response regulator [Rhodospirillaceae bacterium R-7]